MPGDTCNRTSACPYLSITPSTYETSPVPKSLSTVQSHEPNKNLIVITAALVTVTFCFHNSALSCCILNETFEMAQQQETLCFGSTNLGSHIHSQIIQSNRSWRNWRTCKLTLDCFSSCVFWREYDNYFCYYVKKISSIKQRAKFSVHHSESCIKQIDRSSNGTQFIK